jgi:predicted  nucleic acid-binding Zn-ribbon protein
MKQQLNDLVLVQELDSRLADVGATGTRDQEAASGLRPSEARRLRTERAKVAAGVSAELLQRYERLRQRYPRAVVATQRGVCLGCFTVRPTAMASRAVGLEICERCGRILFRVEVTEGRAGAGGQQDATTPVRAAAPRAQPAPRPAPRSRANRRS